ncbi:UDP-glucuronosyl/UDP-glucosyltransferase [Corchorus olitorius]|uniref:UDP-glucuronosyl/UDP-glucosyltransferase n=1 Tax=Corchorus olitorius TaxID=93759 RepID=A0A1R3HPU6_9ROSI|nr:UDP-glucuronosyl/UDP-glucosyltransferase [Corchorus olitorius]
MGEENKAKKLAHVLILPFPGQGHINPMLQFAERLVSKGVKATLVTTIFQSKSVTLSDTTSSNIQLETISDGFDEGGMGQAGNPDTYLSTFKSVGSQSLASLIKKLGETGCPFDAIVYDSFLPWALDVGKKFGLLTAPFFTQSCAVNSIHYHMSKGLIKLPIEEPNVSFPGLPLLQVSDLPSLLYRYGSYPAWFDMIVSQFSNIDEADWVLINSFHHLEKEVIDWMSEIWRLGTIGPTVPSNYLDKRLGNNKDYGISLFKPDTSICMNWLNNKPNGSVVYVSFGSLAELEAEQMAEIAWALSLGVPILAMPQWADQATNAKYVEDVWGVGIRVLLDEEGIVGREVIEQGIKEVMGGERGKEIRKNAIKWKDLAREAVDEGQGHINPMLQFAKRLVAKGVKATLVTTIFLSNSVTLSDPTSSIDLQTISDGFDQGGFAQAKSPHTYMSTFKSVGSQNLASLIKKLGETTRLKFDALVYDSFMPWALDVAKQFGLLTAVFFTQSCAVNSIYYHVSKGTLKLPVEEPNVSIPGLPLLQVSELPFLLYHYGLYPASFDMIVGQFSKHEAADWVLINSFHELEKEVIDKMPEIWKLGTIGPTIPSMFLDKRLENNKDYGMSLLEQNTSTCMNWLNSKPNGSVVYVSFGSMAELGLEQMAEIALGLKESNYYFLWVVRKSEESKLPNNFKVEIGEKGLIVAWCPQLEVLKHESLGCFLSHCGYNSVLEALCLGVPMLAMPQWADQATNAKHVEDVWKIGIRPSLDEKGIVRKEVIKQCINEMMQGEMGKEMKKNADKWKNLAREAVDDGGSSDTNIDEFVSKLVCV